MRIHRLAFACLIGLLAPPLSQPSAAQQGFQTWLIDRLDMLAAAAVEDRPEQQVETPSIADGSTALVDQTSAPDLAGLAFSLFRAGTGGDEAPASVTVSAYAVRNAITQEDPLDPTVYRNGVGARRWSFTLGRQTGSGAGNDTDATLLAVKYLAMNGRDLSKHSDRISDVTAKVAATINFAALNLNVSRLLFQRVGPRLNFAPNQEPAFVNQYLGDRFPELLALLNEEDRAAVDGEIRRSVQGLERARAMIRDLVSSIQQAPQLAFQYQAQLRRADGTDEHRFQAVFDYGLGARLNLSLNASLDVQDGKLLEDTRGGHAAGELQLQLGSGGLLGSRAGSTMRLAVAAMADRQSTQPAVYKAQAKLTMPIPGLSGLTLPFSVTFANRTELIEEREIRGQVGFTVDISKLAKAVGKEE